MPNYEGVAHVQWELPFPLRLPPAAFFCWEPDEGVAAFASGPAVGTLSWNRTSDLLAPADVFPEPGHGPLTHPTRNYRIKSVLRTGRRVLTAELTGGPDGGFREPRPYSLANVGYIRVSQLMKCPDEACFIAVSAYLTGYATGSESVQEPTVR